MTNSRYPERACMDGSQVCADASPADYAWIVGFNNGNANNDHRSNHNRVRAVRASSREFQGAYGQVTFRALHQAWRAARRGKKPSADRLAFDAGWIDGLLDLEERINACTWSPSPCTLFIAAAPKAREIHAPAFADRIVHHWVVPQLEAIYEPGFIHDSFANRKGKGSHAAVDRLRSFVRQVHSGEGGGWYLQLDIHNFFASIHRPTLWRLIRAKMQRAQIPDAAQRVVHALVRTDPMQAGVRIRATAQQRAAVPIHKRLENAARGCGIPIGNLSSQFFANVYLNELDQFVKHTLRAKRYLRYVDDFVLVHHDRTQLEQWQAQIEAFLHDHLRLRLKPDIRLRPLATSIDFLGYIVHPTHTTVRRRVVAHARAAITAWARGHVTAEGLRATPEALRGISSTWASYKGHFAHANAHRLQTQLLTKHPWLRAAAKPRKFPHWRESRVIKIKTGGSR